MFCRMSRLYKKIMYNNYSEHLCCWCLPIFLLEESRFGYYDKKIILCNNFISINYHFINKIYPPTWVSFGK